MKKLFVILLTLSACGGGGGRSGGRNPATDTNTPTCAELGNCPSTNPTDTNPPPTDTPPLIVPTCAELGNCPFVINPYPDFAIQGVETLPESTFNLIESDKIPQLSISGTEGDKIIKFNDYVIDRISIGSSEETILHGLDGLDNEATGKFFGAATGLSYAEFGYWEKQGTALVGGVVSDNDIPIIQQNFKWANLMPLVNVHDQVEFKGAAVGQYTKVENGSVTERQNYVGTAELVIMPHMLQANLSIRFGEWGGGCSLLGSISCGVRSTSGSGTGINAIVGVGAAQGESGFRSLPGGFTFKVYGSDANHISETAGTFDFRQTNGSTTHNLTGAYGGKMQ